MPSKHKKKHHKPSAPAAASTQKTPSTDVDLTLHQSIPPTPVPSEYPEVVVPTAPEIESLEPKPERMAPNPSNTNNVAGTVAKSETPVLTAVKTLINVIKEYKGSTVNGLMQELELEKERYCKNQDPKTPTKCKLAVDSACAQFIRYVTLTLSSFELEDVSKCREQMLNEGMKYLKSCERSIEKISRWAVTLIFDGARILVHSDSLVVLETLRSVPKNIYFSVFIVLDNDTVTSVFKDNYNIDVKVIRDAEVGTLMESMDLVMVGAEAVLKNGGIINKVGTLSLAICAREMNKPLYVLAESFKFSLMYPMSQSDLTREIREVKGSNRIRVDYTLPKYITFLVSDRGLLTPTAVCDELIELYI